MDKIEKVKEWVKKQKKEELARNSVGVITGKALFVDANELLSFLNTLSEEPDKSLKEAAEKFSFISEGVDSKGVAYKDYDLGKLEGFKAGAKWMSIYGNNIKEL